MKNIKLFALAFLGGIVLFTVGCTEDETPDDPVAKTTYADVSTLLNSSCAISGCHADSSQVGSLEGYADAKAFAEFGRLLGAIKHEAGFSPMPKNGTKWSDADIAKIEAWINDGYLEN
jgi:hypothetical protein